MNLEDQLRSTFSAEGDALGSSGVELSEVMRRGRRRKGMKAVGVAFGTVLVVGAAALGISSIGRGPAEPPPVANSTTDAPPVPSTTTAPVTTVGPTVTTAWPPAPFVPVAVATSESESVTGLSVVEPSGEVVTIIEGRLHAADSDGSGGVVFQAQVATEDANRERGAIYRVVAGTAEPVPILEQPPGHVIVMQAVEEIRGVPTLLFTDSFGYESPETARIVLMAHDLSTGETREVAVVGGWESGVTSVSHGGGIILVETSAESEAAWVFLNPEGEQLAARFNPLIACELGDIRCPSAPTMAPDGRLVFVRNVFFDPDGNELDLSGGDFVLLSDEGIVVFNGGEQTYIRDFVERSEIVALDLDTGADELLRSLFNERAQGEDGPAFLGLDFDGRYLIVNDRKEVPTPPAVVFDTEEGTFLPVSLAGRGFFPLAPFELEGAVLSPIGD